MTRSTGCAAAAWWYLLVIAGLIAPSIPQLIPYGTQQFFQYENKISVTDLRNTKAKDISSFTLTATVTVRSIWDQGATQLLLITVHKPKVKTPGDVQKVPKILDKPFYVVLDDGRVSEVLADRSRDAYLLNMRRSIASLLNFRLEDGPVPEVDVSGECIAFYTAKSSTRFEKIKSDCSNWDLKVRYRSEIPLGKYESSLERATILKDDVELSLPVGIDMKPSLKVEYQLAQDASLLKVRSRETHSVALHAKPDAGSKVESVVTLKHVSGSSVEQVKFDSLNDTISSLENFRPYELQAEVDGAVSEIKGMTFTAQVAADKKELADANIGKEAAALLLVKLLPIARITKAEEFVQTFKKHKSITSQLIDLMGATQTIDAHSAIFELFETENKKNFDNLERYLQALAVGTHPDKAIIEDLLERIESGKVKNAKLLDTLIQTTASLVRQSTLGQADKLASQVKKYILIQLVNKCETAECKTQYIRALQNLQFPSTTPTLMKLAAQGQSKVSVAALQALNSFSNKVFCDEDRKQFESIFYQTKRRHDSSARVLALDIILGMKPTKEQLGRLVDYLGSNDSQFEMKAYVLQKLRMASEKCPRFSDLLRAVLAERPHINNYHVMAQRGLTTALQRELSHAPAFNETIISIQEINSGILKRGSVEMILKAGREEISTFRLGIYTSGLTSFIGDSGSDEESEEEDNSVTAGMEIAIQGILLRPLIFFNGQSELMGHVWSGTAADPIPAFLATTLVQDHEHYVILSSGATVYLRVFGARSIDLNGKVDFSLWNRNAHAEIKQSSGTGVVGSMIVGTSFARLENTFTLTNEPKISFIADIDFYSDIKLCIQLGRPETELWQKHEKSVTLTNEWRYTKKVTSKIGHKLPAVTYALNQKNNEMCNMIFS